MKFLNIAAYQFVALDELPTLRTTLKARCVALELRGTILLSPEGINLMLSGMPENITQFQEYLAKDQCFAQLHYKNNYSETIAFDRMLVKIKKEIISLGVPNIDAINHTAPYVKSTELQQWLDEHRDIVLLDTRNDYEVNLGSFDNAINLSIQQFSDFPKALENIDSSLKQKTIVTFCTGGIRCEKAALLMQQQGFQQVYQLEGGILEYFTQCGAKYYHGECFVFDQRNGVDGELKPIA